jgi:hypoxanthine phosphoribosyltransferase
MDGDIDEVLIDRVAIAGRVEALAKEITADLRQEQGGEVGEVTLVPILTGSFIFVADLIRQLPMRMQIRLMSVSSYGGKSVTGGRPRVQEELTQMPASLAGRHVLVIDDILDSGNTLRLVTELLRQRKPASLRTCVLLRKRRESAMAFGVDYVAFDIPDRFVVGYGLDYDDYYRNLPEVVTLKREILASREATSQR